MKHAAYYLRFCQLLCVVLMGLLISFQNVAKTEAQSAVQGYNASQQLASGTIVQLNPSDLTQVEPGIYGGGNKAIGVVVDSSAPDSVIGHNVSPGGTILIASSGVFNILVSNQNGSIYPGDYIELSSVPGVGMAADNITPTVVAQAIDAFSGGNSIATTQVQLPNGTTKTVDIGLVRANIDVESNPMIYSHISGVPTILQSVATFLGAGFISPWRVYLAFTIFCLSVLICLVLAFSTVVSKHRALSRNPMAFGVVRVASINIRMLAAIILVLGFIGTVLVLRL